MISTAIIYMHNFYSKMSPIKFKPIYVSVTCFYLACKVKDNARKIETIINQLYSIIKSNPPQKPAEMKQLTTRIHCVEGILIMVVGLPIILGEQAPEKLITVLRELNVSPSLIQVCYFVCTNMIHLTSLCARYSSNIVAAASLYIGAKWHKVKLPHKLERHDGQSWLALFGKDIKHQVLRTLAEEFVQVFRSSPLQVRQQLKEFRKKHARGIHSEHLFLDHHDKSPAKADLSDFESFDKFSSRSRSVTPLPKSVVDSNGSQNTTPVAPNTVVSDEPHSNSDNPGSTSVNGEDSQLMDIDCLDGITIGKSMKNHTPNSMSHSLTAAKPRLSLADYKQRKLTGGSSSSNLSGSMNDTNEKVRKKIKQEHNQGSSNRDAHRFSSTVQRHHSSDNSVHSSSYQKQRSNLPDDSDKKHRSLTSGHSDHKTVRSGIKTEALVESSLAHRTSVNNQTQKPSFQHSSNASNKTNSLNMISTSLDKRPSTSVSSSRRPSASSPIKSTHKDIRRDKRSSCDPVSTSSSGGEKRSRIDPSFVRSSSSSNLHQRSNMNSTRPPKSHIPPVTDEPSEAYDPADDLHELF